MLQAVILAGGLATRLGPLSQNTPKSLVTVAGRPFLAWQLELLRQAGIERVLLLIGYLGEMIEQYLAEHPVPGLQIDFGREPESQLLGTGGALRWSYDLLEDEFFLLYGDSYLPIEYRQVERFFLEHGRQPVMTVYCNEDRYDRSNVALSEGRVVEYRKGGLGEFRYIDYGLLVLGRSLIGNYPARQPFDLQLPLHELVRRGDLLACEVRCRFWEIGTVSGIRDLEGYLNGAAKN